MRILLPFAFAIISLLPGIAHAATWPASTSATNIGSALMAASPGFEPSGIAWHTGRGTYIVVGNDVAEISSTGAVIDIWSPTGNFEDIAIPDPTSSLVYLANENASTIVEFNLDTGTATGNTWDISDYIYQIGALGMEGLTWVPDGDHPYGTTRSGGVFYAGWQYDADIYVFDVDLSTSGSFTYLDQIRTTRGYSDLSGLAYNTATATLFTVYDGYNLVEERAADGTFITSYTIPVSGAWEGITVVDSCPTSTNATLAFANDDDGISAYGSYTAACVIVDSDGDGVYSDVDCNDADASVATLQTYFRDQDKDGYGDAATTTTLCSAVAPSGYVTNDDDRYPYNRIELYGDGVDNDGDPSIDEANTLTENGIHPTYGVMNPYTTSGVVTALGVSSTGGFLISYPDSARYDFNVGGAAVAGRMSITAGTSFARATVGMTTTTLNTFTGTRSVTFSPLKIYKKSWSWKNFRFTK